MRLDAWRDKKVLILGFGREGQDSLLFLRRIFPEKIIGIADQKEKRALIAEIRRLTKKEGQIKLRAGKNYLKSLKDYDVIIKAPGVAPKTIKPFIRPGQEITSQTQIFFENCPGRIVGITGTKGKSTTTSLIYRVLKEGGLKAHLVGNIGQPVLSALFRARPADVFVYELSSHQLMNLKRSPQVAVFLNIYPEHLDYYQSFAEYLRAKQNICRYQGATDFFLFNPQDRNVSKTQKITRARKVALDPERAERFLKKWGRTKLVGRFNFLNLAAAIEVGRIFKIPEKKIAQAIKDFSPLPHRLELVGEYRGIKFYNDSLATIPEATIAALDALGPRVETIFLGGFDRGLDFRKLAARIMKSQIQTLILWPTTGQKIWRAIVRTNSGKARFFNHFFVVNMEEAVKLAFRHTRRGKICLLSCASPSFGLFHDYQERGELFKKCVRQQGNKQV
ncbi:MAG: UDP-N-acetylmuramoyl-L-alanine--D-glutamate ligase [Candidatus Nealsonbacteria bacterium]|nr:UDP-N-acetylmuramoyl-L-alanine--D-glutamate ligase [Candidatus Nealsonbacteria bacterium]